MQTQRSLGRIAPMPPLALVVCPLPADRPAARLAQTLLTELAQGEGVVLFCPEPFQAPAAWERDHRLLPLADLAFERARGAVGAPVWLRDGGPGEEAFARREVDVPGVVVDARSPVTAASLRAAVAAIRTPPAVQPAKPRPTVEAMVLAYKSKDYVTPCLQSLLDQDWPNLKITVLDNASGDGTAEFVRRKFPSIEVLESKENLGFAAGHNVLFERTRADYVALLNHDAIARRDWIAELVSAAEALPKGAAFGGKMLMRRCPTILNSTGIVMNESGFAADRDIGRPDLAVSQAPERVFAACGGALLLRGSVLRTIGGFDPTFFMYVEDVDWCWRARLAGHEVWYVPSATCVHDWHGDMAAAAGKAKTAQSADAVAELEGRRRFMVERNRLLSVYKNWDRSNLGRVWRGLLAHDRGRREALAAHVAAGGGPLPQRVLQAIEAAHSYCRKKRLSMWWSRRRTQQLRQAADATFAELIVPGFAEPSGVGDLHAIVDRYCAKGRAEIVMATGDRGCLGPGWHHPEPAADGNGGLRWSMGECWFYLQSEVLWHEVRMAVVPQPLDTWAELWIDGILVQRHTVARGVPHELAWTLPTPAKAGRLVECRLRCGTFVPQREGMGDDTRELGLHITTIRAVATALPSATKSV